MKKTFVCTDCHKTYNVQQHGGTGYTTINGRKRCYSCCGVRDEKQLLLLKPKEKMYMYLSEDKDGYMKITNWPESFVIDRHIGHIYCIVRKHNICKKVYYVYFQYKGEKFWGKNIGDNNVLIVRKRKT